MIQQAIEKLASLLQGKIPANIDSSEAANENDRRLAELMNQLITFIDEIHRFIIPLAQGELSDIKPAPNNFLASPFKELHSRLRHLTWQAKQVASGDYLQRVDFMGEFSEAFNAMIIALERNERLLRNKIDELEQALGHIKKLEGILPICANCKRIRVENAAPQNQRSWIKIESYLSARTDAQFSHSICPECMQKLYPDLTKD
jgi:DNA repair exonuclease SbcCD ATPase subunit